MCKRIQLFEILLTGVGAKKCLKPVASLPWSHAQRLWLPRHQQTLRATHTFSGEGSRSACDKH